MIFDLCTHFHNPSDCRRHRPSLRNTQKSCLQPILFLFTHHNHTPLARDRLDYCDSGVSTIVAAAIAVTATRIPASDRPSETKLHKQTHQKRGHAHTKTHSGLGLSILLLFSLFSFSSSWSFLVLAWVSISYTIQYPRIHRKPRVSTPRDETNLASKQSQFLDRLIWLN